MRAVTKEIRIAASQQATKTAQGCPVRMYEQYGGRSKGGGLPGQQVLKGQRPGIIVHTRAAAFEDGQEGRRSTGSTRRADAKRVPSVQRAKLGEQGRRAGRGRQPGDTREGNNDVEHEHAEWYAEDGRVADRYGPCCGELEGGLTGWRPTSEAPTSI